MTFTPFLFLKKRKADKPLDNQAKPIGFAGHVNATHLHEGLSKEKLQNSSSFSVRALESGQSKEKPRGIALQYPFSRRPAGNFYLKVSSKLRGFTPLRIRPTKWAAETGRGQVSVEILMSGLFLMTLFIVVLLINHQSTQAHERLQQNIIEEEMCIKLSSIITYMNSNPPYTETVLELSADVNIVSNSIYVGDIFCPFLGNASNVQLRTGRVKAFDLNGLVVFTNDLNYNPLNPPVNVPPSNSNISGALLVLLDDQSQQWISEVQADDVLYASSADDQNVDPDWVEFQFSNLGLTPTASLQDVRVLIKHLEGSLLGLTAEKRRIQCWDGNTWIDVGFYDADFVETVYQSPNLNTCISDLNSANHARIRMTYEPNGFGSNISIDYGRIDVNYLFIGQIIDLWERATDLPQPLDFRTDINSTSNTFGAGNGNDGWDWQRNTYGGALAAAAFNADPNFDNSISDSTVPQSGRIEIKIGGGVPGASSDPDDNSIIGPAASGSYGIQFDINSSMWTAIQGGAQVTMSFVYTVDADAGWGNALGPGEEGWVKARFGNATTMNYLGWDLDQTDNDADATNEIWWADQPTDYYGFFSQDVRTLITGPGTYYLDFGAALSDWDYSNEGIGLYFDNINLVIA